MGDQCRDHQAGRRTIPLDDQVQQVTHRCALIGADRDDIAAISAYSDPDNYQRINFNFYRRRETRINAALRAALSKCVIPDGVIAWRGAGFKLYRYPEQGPVSSRAGRKELSGASSTIVRQSRHL